MAGNLLKQVMMKPEKQDGGIDTKALIEKMESGYLADRGPKFQTKKSFSPSTIAYGHGECPRYWFLAFSGGTFTDNAKPADVANMSNGTLSHERIEKAVKGSGILLDSEFKVINEDPPIFGYGDLLLDWNGEEIVGEIKTTRDEAFEYRKRTNTAKLGHIIQTIIYMKIMKKSKGVIIYENKNSHELFAVPVVVNDTYIKWVDDAFEWMRTVHKAWKDKELPKKNYRSNSKICKNCPLANECALAEAGTIKIPSLEGLSEAV